MPFKSDEARRAYHREYQRKRYHGGEKPHRPGQYSKSRDRRRNGRPLSDYAEEPEACFTLFFTTKPCRGKAQWTSPSGARWCNACAMRQSDAVRITEFESKA